MKPPSPPPLHIPQNSKRKRVFMDSEVVEIPPPVHAISKSAKRKELIPEIINLDYYEGPSDVMILGKRVDGKNKGKAIKHLSDGFGYSQPKDFFSNQSSMEMNGVTIFGTSLSDNENSNLPNGNEYPGKWFEDPVDAMDHFTTLQDHFDGMDIPSGVEANIPLYPDLAQSKEKLFGGPSSVFSPPDLAIDSAPPQSYFPNNMTPIPGSIYGNHSGGNLCPPWLFPDSAYNGMNQALLQIGKISLNHPSGQPSKASRSKNKKVGFSSSTKHGKLPNWGHDNPMTALTQAFSLSIPPQLPTFPPPVAHSSTTLFGHQVQFGASIDEVICTPTNQSNVNEEDIRKKFHLFKQFDTVESHSDHHYAVKAPSKKQPPKKWAKAIQDEWRILEKDLPDTIFVRVYESRMDILRAAIIGVEGTPYHDGLFFFDVFFPDAYPNVPPHVFYHSGGLRLNPNLYKNGKVCLSLLHTWSGSKNEMWISGTSTMLQVLVSIQALILNKNPFFNEPGYAGMNGSAHGDVQSRQYNEDTLILSLKTMLYTMKKPPKHFEDFVVGHFYGRAHDILVACKAYMEGAQVGCLVKGGVQDLDAGDNKSCSDKFKSGVKGIINLLVQAFSKIGAKDCNKFLMPETEVRKRVVVDPRASNLKAAAYKFMF